MAKDRRERLQAIADALAADGSDIICLQELWVNADYQLIRERVSKSLPNSKRWFSGALGSGLAIFTRFPIIETSIKPYALNGSPLDVAGGDFFVGKSVVSVVCQHPLLSEVEIFNTHVSYVVRHPRRRLDRSLRCTLKAVKRVMNGEDPIV